MASPSSTLLHKLRRSREFYRAARTRRHVSHGRLVIGRHSHATPRLRDFGGPRGRVIIGSYVSMSHDCEILLGGEHRTDWITTAALEEIFPSPSASPKLHLGTRGDVVIGNDVWIGAYVKILSGVRIGDGAVIGAGSLLSADVPPYTIAAGNPARALRARFAPEQIEALLRIRWWEWDDRRVVEHRALLQSGDVDGFIARFDPAAASA